MSAEIVKGKVVIDMSDYHPYDDPADDSDESELNCCGMYGDEHWFGCPNEGDTNDHIYNNPRKLANCLETQRSFNEAE